ncbi:hypothetical protein [Paracidovorax citrulli]|uniref:hypothetical protein n=1 Tax=Paracidovorax citrulli TaxID=80869 RepID=UPI001F2B2C44|nr:hypothetical protein [Paracidovorax citrulli]
MTTTKQLKNLEAELLKMQGNKDMAFYAKCIVTFLFSMLVSAVYLLVFYRLPHNIDSLLSCLWISYPVFLPVVLAIYRKSTPLLVFGLCGGCIYVFAGSLFFSPGDEGGASLAQIPFMFFGLIFSSLFISFCLIWGKLNKNH